METLLHSIEQIQGLIAEIRNLRKGYLTNFYLDAFKHQVWINSGDFKFVKIGETLFFARISDDFCNLFYCSTTIKELTEAFRQLEQQYPGLLKMVDVVGSDIQCQPIMDMLESHGYCIYRQLVRMSRMTPKDTVGINNPHIYFATPDDAKKVRELLFQYFDARCEQIPYQEELNEYAKNNHILVYKEEGEIIGFVIFESSRSTHYLRYWFVHPKHRDKKIGSILLKTFFYEGRNTRRQLFWVITDNENAIKRYEHYGYKNEEMKDYVLTKNIVGGVKS